MTAQLDLIASIPDAVTPQPTMWIVIAQYCGPGWAHGNWKVFGPFITEIEAERASEKFNRWMKRRQIFKT